MILHESWHACHRNYSNLASLTLPEDKEWWEPKTRQMALAQGSVSKSGLWAEAVAAGRDGSPRPRNQEALSKHGKHCILLPTHGLFKKKHSFIGYSRLHFSKNKSEEKGKYRNSFLCMFLQVEKTNFPSTLIVKNGLEIWRQDIRQNYLRITLNVLEYYPNSQVIEASCITQASPESRCGELMSPHWIPLVDTWTMAGRKLGVVALEQEVVFVPVRSYL